MYLTYNNYSSIKYTDSAFWANSITFAKGSLLQELVFENVDFRVQNGEDTSLDTSQVSKSNFYAFKITMKDVYVENWVPDGKALTWTLGNYDLMAGIGAEVEIDGLTFASGTSSYFDLNMTVGDLTLRNVTWDSPGALQVNIFGSLTEEISFTDTMSSEVRFSAVADNNIVDENFTGKLTVGYKVGSFTVWNPDNAADINASEIVVSTNETILYTDTLDQYKGTFTATDQYYLELRHDEDVDRFATHEFSANTTISGAVSPGYSMAEKAYGWGTNSNILKLQAGDDFDIMVIGDGDGTAAGGFSNITYYDDSFDSYQGYEGAYEFFATYAYDFRTYLPKANSYDLTAGDVVLNNVYHETPDNVAILHFDATVYQIQDGDDKITGMIKLKGVEVKTGEYYTLRGSIGSSTQYIDLDEGFSGEGGLAFVDDNAEDGIVSEIYLGGSNNTYTGATEIYSDVELHLENADTIASSSALIMYGNASLVIDYDTGTTNVFDNFEKVTLVGTSSEATDTGETVTTIKGGGATLNLSGKGSYFSFLQDDTMNPDSSDKAENTAVSANGETKDTSLMQHHVVEVSDLTVNLENGASLLVNYLGTPDNGNYDPVNSADLGIFVLGNGTDIRLDGYDAVSNTSAHLYLGNGVLRLDDGSSLTLSGGAGIHFSDHSGDMFEYPYEVNGTTPSVQDTHGHASIELNGGMLNFVLDEKAHIYSDHLISSDHNHYLAGASMVDSSGQAISNPVDVANSITFSMTQTALDTVAGLIPETITQEWANEHHVSMEAAQELQKIYNGKDGEFKGLIDAITGVTALSAGGVSLLADGTVNQNTLAQLEAEFNNNSAGLKMSFNDFLSTLVTLGMNNDVHNNTADETLFFQVYGITFTDKGAYMHVLENLTIEEIIEKTDINVSIKNQVNEVIQSIGNGSTAAYGNSGAFEIISKAVNYTNGKTAEEFKIAARVMDASAQAATVAGVQTFAWDMLQTRSDSTQRHLDSIKKLPDNKLHLWADFLYMHNNSHGMWTDVNGERDVQADLGGFIAGGDYRYNENAAAGASFSFMAGTAETFIGDTMGLDVDNDIYALAGSVYAQYEFNSGWRVRGDISYQYADNDIEMIFPSVFSLENLTADVAANAVQVLAAVEKDITLADTVVLTPYIGAKYTYLHTGEYTSKLGSNDAFYTDAAEQHIFSVPVGVKVSKEIELKNGKKFTPRAGVYVQPNFGETKVKNHVQGIGFTSSDFIYPEVIGEFSFGGHIGAEAELSDIFSIGLDYNYNGSEKSNNHNITASFVVKF